MQDRPSLMIPQLGRDPTSPFPPSDTALQDPDGLLAWGGDLHPRRLAIAYRRGIFPWYSEEQPILWWCPARRAVLFPNEVHVSRRLARVLRQGRFTVSADTDFKAVITACAQPRRKQSSTWITPDMVQAYVRLHREGLAHSVEVRENGKLVGGLYGLAMGSVFFGESMFSASSDASKVGLVRLCQAMSRCRYALLDCQVMNAHLATMGARNLPRDAFLSLLRSHVDREAKPFAQLFREEEPAE